MGSWSSQKDEVKRLAAAAGLAAEREQLCRHGLVMRGRRIVKSGRVLALAAVAGIAVVAVFRRRDGDDRDSGDRHTGVVAVVGNQLLHLMQFALTASHLWTSISAGPEVSTATESIREN